ncbi:MAG: DUF2090 domain-containing protein [Candidatus Portnoybacteria bacterium]|nr:DUF2090 domain-containing protein [Candidatus Portnoybacteria bacterium]
MKHTPQKLYILPFDHRGSFIKMFGLAEDNLTNADVKKLNDYKHIVYEGFLEALNMGVPKQYAALLVDEQFGSAIQLEAKKKGITRLLPVEISGQDEFDFEYGIDFGTHIDTFSPEYVKVLVRYNPEGDTQSNNRQIQKLKVVNDFCHTRGYGFLFELLVPPTPQQLERCHGSEDVYEHTMRGKLMEKAMEELQEGGIEPDVWKLEGLENPQDMREVVKQGRKDQREHVGIVVLGRGESDEKVKKWLSAAAGVSGVIGFAVGRTVWKEALLQHLAGKISRKEASEIIAKNFKSYVDLFLSVR